MKARFSVKTNTNSKTNQSYAFEKKMWQWQETCFMGLFSNLWSLTVSIMHPGLSYYSLMWIPWIKENHRGLKQHEGELPWTSLLQESFVLFFKACISVIVQFVITPAVVILQWHLASCGAPRGSCPGLLFFLPEPPLDQSEHSPEVLKCEKCVLNFNGSNQIANRKAAETYKVWNSKCFQQHTCSTRHSLSLSKRERRSW